MERSSTEHEIPLSASPSLTPNYCSTLGYMHATYANPLSTSFEQRQRCASFPLALFWCHPTAPLHAHEYSQFSSGYMHIHSYMWSPPLPATWLLLCSPKHGAQLNTCYFFLFLFAYSETGIHKKIKKMPKKAISVKELR